MDQVAYISIPLFLGMILFILVVEVGVGKKATRPLRIVLFSIYLFLNLSETLLFRTRKDAASYILTPFWSYRAAFGGDPTMWPQILLNILLYVPFGFLLDDSSRMKKRPLLIILSGFLFSCGTELVQLVFRLGCFEFDDIINNTLGCAVGLGFHRLVLWVVLRLGHICPYKRS